MIFIQEQKKDAVINDVACVIHICVLYMNCA